MMPTVLYVSPFAFEVSGADESLVALLQELSGRKFELHVAAPLRSPYHPKFRGAGAQTHGIPMLRLKRSRNPIYWALFLFWLPVEIILFWRLMKKTSASIVHVNMESTLAPMLAAYFSGVPLIVHYRGKTLDTPKWFFDPFLRLIHSLASHVFAISESSGNGFKSRHLTKKLEILFNAVDLKRFDAPSSEEFFDQWPKFFKGKKVVTFLGRLDPQKRIMDLIDAATQLSSSREDLAFVVLGGDSEIREEAEHLRELEEYIVGKTPRPPIYFLGRTTNVVQALRSSSVFVLPSVNEGFGRVVIEAMAAGVPVIVADSGALPELVEGGRYGRLVPPLRPDLLAQSILDTLGSSETATICQRAKEHVKANFDITQHVEKIVRQYDRLLSSSNSVR